MTTSNGQPGQGGNLARNLAPSLRSALARASELRDQRPGRESRRRKRRVAAPASPGLLTGWPRLSSGL
jgi:hypothetical protein